MLEILSLLARLDEIYHAGNLDVYEQLWQEMLGMIEQHFPGCTLAYAEIYNVGADRAPHGSMRHCVVPKERTN